MRRTILAPLVAASLLLAGLLAGCGDGGDDPEATPSSTPGDVASSAPSVEAATGVLVDLDRVRMRAPDGWRKNDPLSTFLLKVDDPSGFSSVSLSDLSAVGEVSLQQQARTALQSFPRAEAVEPVEIAGVPWYHITGPQDRYTTVDQFGTIHNGSEAVIEFGFDNEVPEAEQQEIIDSVLATVEWK